MNQRKVKIPYVSLATAKLHIRWQPNWTFCGLYIPDGFADLDREVDGEQVCLVYSRAYQRETNEKDGMTGRTERPS